MVDWNDFVNIALKSFKYLETKYGFKIKSTNPPYVTYVSNKIELDVFYDINGRRELDLGITSLTKLNDIKEFNRMYDLEWLIRVNTDDGIDENLENLVSYPKTKFELEIHVKELSNLLLKYGEDVLKGELSSLLRIDKRLDDLP